MNKDNLNMLMLNLNDKVPEESTLWLRQKLENADDSLVSTIACLNLYNPTHILLFSVFVGGFGVDRFMIDDIGLGVAKLLLNVFTCGIWAIVDIFICYKCAKDKNLKKIISILP